jgi:hypothetical protein
MIYTQAPSRVFFNEAVCRRPHQPIQCFPCSFTLTPLYSQTNHKSPTVNTELTVLGSTYCNAVTGTILPKAQVTIKNSQVGLLYEVWSKRGGDHAYSEAVPANGGDLTI